MAIHIETDPTHKIRYQGNDMKSLTRGKAYIIWGSDGLKFLIQNNNGVKKWYEKYRFDAPHLINPNDND